VQNQKDSALIELRTGPWPSTFALATLIFGIAALSALSLFVIAGQAALCFLIVAFAAPRATACGSVVRPREGLEVGVSAGKRNLLERRQF
jgi:hypothetical protein